MGDGRSVFFIFAALQAARAVMFSGEAQRLRYFLEDMVIFAVGMSRPCVQRSWDLDSNR